MLKHTCICWSICSSCFLPASISCWCWK